MSRNLAIPRQRFSPEETIAHLRLLNKRGKLSAFIGAGVSASCGLPDWNTLRMGIEQELLSKNLAASYTANNIEDVARIEFGDHFNSIVAKLLYSNHIQISNQIKLIVKSGIERIVCFNFDDLLEEALNTEIIEHKVILNGEMFNGNYPSLTIFHPHGYLERYAKKSHYKETKIVISENDYNELYNDHYCLTNLIQLSVLLNNSVLFIGMSLNDSNITRLLNTSWKLGARHKHFAIMKTCRTKKENKVIVKRFKNLGVEPLWVKGFGQIDNILRSIKVTKPFNTSENTVSVNTNNLKGHNNLIHRMARKSATLEAVGLGGATADE